MREKNPQQTKEDLLERIRSAYDALEDTLRPLSEAQLANPGRDGWAIKDHLAHLATWELGIVELLQRRPRFAGPELEEAVRQEKSEEEINEIIYRQNAALGAAQAVDLYREAHRQMLRVLEGMRDEDLFAPYTAFLSEGEDGPSDPVLNWIVGNTYEHYNDHNRWIQAMLSGA